MIAVEATAPFYSDVLRKMGLVERLVPGCHAVSDGKRAGDDEEGFFLVAFPLPFAKARDTAGSNNSSVTPVQLIEVDVVR